MSGVQVQKEVDVSRLVGDWIHMYSSFSSKSDVHRVELSANGGFHFKQSRDETYNRTLQRVDPTSFDGRFEDVPSTSCFCFESKQQEFIIVETDYDHYLITSTKINGKIRKVDIFIRDIMQRNDTTLWAHFATVVTNKCKMPWDKMIFILH